MPQFILKMKASTLIVTHNHNRWIADAVDSALAQKTDFDFDVVIAVDKGQDRTIDSAKQYATYHENVTALDCHKNIGGKHNFARALAYAEGEFIAYMDGDDFWNCPNKLQDQVAFLESNPDFACSVTQAEIEYHGHLDKRFESHYTRTQETWEGEDVINMPAFCATASLVFRKADIWPLPQWFFDIAWGDSAIRGILAKQGKFHYLQRKCVTYRCNDWGAISKLRKKGKAYMAEAAETIKHYITNHEHFTPNP